MRASSVLMIAVALAGSGMLSARPARQSPSLQDWLDAVTQHTLGQWDGPAAVVGSWSSADLRAVYDALRPQLGEPGRRRADMNPILFAGAMLHTDIAMLGARRQKSVAPGDRLVALLIDGRDYGRQAAEPGWAFARQLLDAVAPDAAGDQIVKLWYRATTAHMARYALLGDVEAHLEHARQLFPDDAAVLFDSGWFFEAFAGARTQAVVAELVPPLVPSVGESLKRAEEFYTRALEVTPGDVEARVHRGRVRSLRGRHKDAIADLRAALEGATDPYVKYHAALFLGGAYEALDDIEQARGAYERAGAIYPLAQSPHLALNRLATHRGDMPAAQREVQQVLRLSPNAPNRGDPWWTYHLGSGRRVDAALVELRGAIKAARGPS